MARSTEHAALICTICTILTIAGIAAGWYWHKPVIAIIGLLPAVIYEVYRTEGVSTIWASWGMLAILIAEAVLIIGKINIDIAKYASKYIPNFPSVDVSLVGPVIMAYFSYVLIRRTAGIYTKWLAAVILIGCIGLFLVLDPAIISKIRGNKMIDVQKIEETIKKIPSK